MMAQLYQTCRLLHIQSKIPYLYDKLGYHPGMASVFALKLACWMYLVTVLVKSAVPSLASIGSLTGLVFYLLIGSNH